VTDFGIIAKRGYNFKREKDGSLTIDYKSKEPYIKKKEASKDSKRNIKEELSEGVSSLEEQRKFALERQKNLKKDKNKEEIDREVIE
jgi:hypothetical protein